MDPRIHQTIKIMDENLDKKLTLKSVSQMFNLSGVYFSELFKKETGICFSRYLAQLRNR